MLQTFWYDWQLPTIHKCDSISSVVIIVLVNILLQHQSRLSSFLWLVHRYFSNVPRTPDFSYITDSTPWRNVDVPTSMRRWTGMM